jgi:hypothetical protein
VVVLFDQTKFQSSGTPVAPSGYTLDNTGQGSQPQQNMAYKLIASAITEDPGAWQNTGYSAGADHMLHTLALKPLASTTIDYTVGEQEFNTSVTEISPTAPLYVEGDLLVGIGYRNNDGDCYFNDDGTTWTEDTEYQTNGPDYTGYLAWKIATSSDMGTIDFGTTGAASVLRARVIRFKAGTFDPVNPMDAVSTTVQQNNTDDPDPAAITTVTDNARVFTFVYTGNADDAQSRTPPSGYTLDGENQGAGEFALASKEIATAAAENPGAWSGFSTGATADMGVITFAIRPAPSATLTSIVQSTERVTIDWDATSEPVTQNLSKGQDETRCVPFFTKRLVSGSLTDDFRERTMKVEMIDNAGTPAVRVTASGKSSANDHRIEVYVVEFVPGIGVQQVDADIADTNSSANITITDVGAQTDAFFLYSYQYTHGSAQDRPDYACVRPVWNGASTTSVTIERTGSTGTIDGMLYVVSCENSEFSVQHRDISVAATDELTNDTITASPMATTFLLTHFRSSEAEDDPLDWSFVADLSTTTNVRVRRSIAGASNAAANVGVQVVTAQGGQWSVQRGDFTTTSNLTEQTVISAVDLTRAFVKTGTHESGLNSLGTSDLTAGTIIDEVGPAAYLSATNTITWVRESVSETGNTIPYEVIQFSAGLDNPILIPTGPLR